MSSLPNIGHDFRFKPEEIRRFIFCLYKKDDGDLNQILLASAVTLANWQTQFNQYNFEANTSDKYVCTPLIFGAAAAPGDPVVFDTNGYYRILQDGSVDFTWIQYDVAPNVARQYKSLMDYELAVWPVTQDTRVLGILDGTYLKPIRVQNLSSPNYTPPTRESPAVLECRFRINAGSDMNNLVAVTIASADVSDDSDFFSLRDVTGTVDTPAVTGCNVSLQLNEVDPSAPATPIYLTSDTVAFGDITFTDNATGSDVTLAAAGSLSYSAVTHKHTINESALLTTAHAYTLKIRCSGFDIACGTVTIP